VQNEARVLSVNDLTRCRPELPSLTMSSTVVDRSARVRIHAVRAYRV